MATAPRTPQPPSSIPTQPKKGGVFSSSSLSRRTSLGTSSQGIGYSPGPSNASTPAGSGIPAFRTLRSFLPFGPNKNAASSSSNVASSPSTSKSPFSGFGSVRRSMTKDRERKVSLSNDVLSPVIAIERPSLGEGPLRRSVSLSNMEKPLPSEPLLDEPDPFQWNDAAGNLYGLRTPSPGPPLSVELSTIIEADSSGVSKTLGLSTPSDSRSPSPPNGRDFFPTTLAHHKYQSSLPNARPPPNAFAARQQKDLDAENSALDLSTTNLADQVRNALLNGDSSPNSVKQWRNVDKAVVVIDADESANADLGLVDPDASFNLDTADPELVALLSPNTLAKTMSTNGSSHSLTRTSTAAPPKAEPRPSTSPTTPTSRLPRSRQASSFLPRLRPSSSYSVASSSPTTRNFTIPTPSPTTPSANAPTPKASPNHDVRPAVPVNGTDSPPTSPISGGGAQTSTPATNKPVRTMSLAKPAAKTFTSNRSSSLSASQSRIFGATSNGDTDTPASAAKHRGPVRTLRQVVLGVANSNNRESEGPSGVPPSPTGSSTSASSKFGRGSLDIRRPLSSASEIGLGRPSSASLDLHRGSFDSRRATGGRKREREGGRHASGSPERSSGVFTAPSLTRSSTAGSLDVESQPSTLSSPNTPFQEPQYRPSLESTAPTSASRPSFESIIATPTLRSRERERLATPSLRVIEPSSDDISPTTTPLLPAPLLRGPQPNRLRKRSMSVQERPGRMIGMSRSDSEGNHGIIRPGSSLSASGGRGLRALHRGMASSSEMDLSSSVGSSGPKHEWLGPRTVKAFRAAGLLDPDREKEVALKDRERDDSSRLRDRSGSVGGVLAPSPLGNGGSSSALNRFASLRAASEYNPTPSRANSRMAFSEVGGVTGRRGSESLSVFGGSSGSHGQGLLESPTFTASSGSRGERDTPRSSSTAPTSLSDAFGYFGRDRDGRERERDREEMREMRDKHATEMAALLNALSDSQRTVRMLREENTDLRDRLDSFGRVVEENGQLRQACAELEQECMDLREDIADMRKETASMNSSNRYPVRAPAFLGSSWSGSSSSSGLRTPIPKPATSSPLTMVVTPRYEDENAEYDNTMIIHDSIDHDIDTQHDTFQHLKAFAPSSPIRRSIDSKASSKYASSGLLDDNILPASESTPSIKRRLSTSSSIFPVPPPNMTMLLDDDVILPMGNESNRSSIHSHFRTNPIPAASPQPSYTSPTAPIPTPKARSRSRSSSFSSPAPPVTFKSFATASPFQPNKSNVSGVSISPTTADFSMVTGSPRSLFLRPEHELLLGDMESLDLGTRGPIDLDLGTRKDDW